VNSDRRLTSPSPPLLPPSAAPSQLDPRLLQLLPPTGLGNQTRSRLSEQPEASIRASMARQRTVPPWGRLTLSGTPEPRSQRRTVLSSEPARHARRGSHAHAPTLNKSSVQRCNPRGMPTCCEQVVLRKQLGCPHCAAVSVELVLLWTPAPALERCHFSTVQSMPRARGRKRKRGEERRGEEMIQSNRAGLGSTGH
jgi:hypothetical protein